MDVMFLLHRSPGIPQTGSTNRSGGSGGSARSFSPYVPSPDAAGSPLQPRRIGGSAASLLMQAGVSEFDVYAKGCKHYSCGMFVHELWSF